MVTSTNSNLMQAETTCPIRIFIFTLLSCIFGNAYLVSYPTQYCSTLIRPYIVRSISFSKRLGLFSNFHICWGSECISPPWRKYGNFWKYENIPFLLWLEMLGKPQLLFLQSAFLAEPLLFGPSLSHSSHHAWPVLASPQGCGCPSARGMPWLPDPTITHLGTSQHSWNRGLWSPDRSL